MENGYSLSDIRAATRDNENWGGNSDILWLILFMYAMFGGGGFGGFGGFGGANGALTRAEMQQGFDTAEITRKLDGMSYGIADATYALTNSITNEGRAMQMKLADSDCSIKMLVKDLFAQNDRSTCAVTTAIHEEGEQTRALIRENEIKNLRDKVQQLEMDRAMCGVVRYPNQMAYTTNCNPFGGNNGCGCGGNNGCGCGCNNI